LPFRFNGRALFLLPVPGGEDTYVNGELRQTTLAIGTTETLRKHRGGEQP